VIAESAGAGAGTTFRVFIPLTMVKKEEAEPAPLLGPSSEASKISPLRRLDELRILVVDDDPEARELFCAVVEQAGAEVRAAGSARDALSILPAWEPDVLLSDIEMPQEDGFVLMNQVTALDAGDSPERRKLVAIAVTAHSRPEDRLRALEAGFTWHLPKPIEPSELVAVIASLTGRAHRLAPRSR
jgi:CheY-like chemotaxis protein